jgi:hypothetical protein
MKQTNRNRSLERWNLLRERYENRGLVLALGAGLSSGCRLPSWPELLQRIGEECFETEGRETVQILIDAGTTLPAVAGILESKRPKNVPFLDVLGRALYRDFPFRKVINTESLKHELVQFVQDNNPTMRAVAALCAKPGSGNIPFEANERIRAVVNFNVDSVLRSYSRARYRTYLFRTIESANKLAKLDRIPVYHMHGFLKFYKSDRQDDDETVPCVFTEGEYFDFFNRPHSVFNYTFLYLLREFNCLFVGMSMNDDNIRRLLHYSTAERRQRAKESGQDAERKGLRHFAILKRSKSSNLDELTDISLRRLGTRALWIEEFDEIPDRLAFVYSEKTWKTVF